MSHTRNPIAPADPGQAVVDNRVEDGERVAKVLARAGIASRREVERLIAAGRVTLNGAVLATPAIKVGPADVVTVDGRPVAVREPARVWRYHKPAGLVTSHKDPQGRPTVFEALPADLPRVISVGRLDLNSEGLLLLTNDGELARALELPATGLVRRYRARARGRTTQARLDSLKDGVTVDGVRYGPIDARLDEVKGPGAGEGVNHWITVTLSEGKNREVRKVLESLDLSVNRLIRLSYGPFDLGDLKPGEVVEVSGSAIRERLAPYVDPEQLAKGERRAPPRPAKTSAKPGAKSGAQSGEPTREPREKPVYKTGWAKPRKRPGPAKAKTAKPQAMGAQAPRPKATRPKATRKPAPSSSREG